MDELTDLFQFAGLTKYESNALAALFYLRESSVEELAKKSEVPLPKLYEVLKNLERKGFVSASLNRPIKYRIVPPTISFAKYLGKQAQDLERAKKNLSLISKKFYKLSNPSVNQTQVLRNRAFVLKFLSEHLKNSTKKSCFACIAFKSSHTDAMPIMKKKILKGLDCRIIGCLPGGNEYIAEKYKALGAKVKILEKETPPFRFNVYDNEYISATLLDEPKDYLTIWSNAKSTVQTFSDLFSFYWSIGKDF